MHTGTVCIESEQALLNVHIHLGFQDVLLPLLSHMVLKLW